jgi:hypothetical protein
MNIKGPVEVVLHSNGDADSAGLRSLAFFPQTVADTPGENPHLSVSGRGEGSLPSAREQRERAFL